MQSSQNNPLQLLINDNGLQGGSGYLGQGQIQHQMYTRNLDMGQGNINQMGQQLHQQAPQPQYKLNKSNNSSETNGNEMSSPSHPSLPSSNSSSASSSPAGMSSSMTSSQTNANAYNSM